VGRVIGPQVSIVTILVTVILVAYHIDLHLVYIIMQKHYIGRNLFVPDQFKPMVAEICEPC